MTDGTENLDHHENQEVPRPSSDETRQSAPPGSAPESTDDGTSRNVDVAPPTTTSSPASSPSSTDEDVQLLLAQAEQAIRSVDEPAQSEAGGLEPFELTDLAGTPANTERASLDLLRDVELDLRIELGRTHMYLEDVLELRKGSVVPLDKLAGDPVDVFVNGRLVARGEVLVLNDNFCVRIAELIAGNDGE
jgi:flagellar motor switch protein FliN/FliY